MSTDAPAPAALATLRASRAQQEAVVRWLRPLAPLVMIVVVWAAFGARPGPGLGGRGLAVSIALGGFVAAGIGVLATLRRPGPVHVGIVAVVLAASVALMWLQTGGVAVAGVFVGLSLLAPRSRGRRSVLPVVVGLVTVGAVLAVGNHASAASVLLNAIMLGSFYGMLFLAVRLADANRLAERLVDELERSRVAETRAAGLAERQRLAREMHDVLAHSLSGLLLQLEGARMLAAGDPADPRLRPAVDRAHQLGKAGLDEARRAIGLLREDGELPGPERLAGLAAQFQRDRDIPTRFTVTGDERDLGSEARLALYRVAQEALTNIARHARPERVELHLSYGPDATRLVVEDFGSGGGPAAPPGSTGGYGLTGMRERAALLGGTLTSGATGQGFRVELDVPR